MAQHVSRKMRSKLTRFAPFVSLLALAACSGVLGIEDLHEGPAPGSAGSGGTDSNGGDSAIGGDGAGPSGGASTMTGGGSAGKGQGQGGGSAGSSVVGAAGAVGEAGAGAGIGAGGEGPTGGTTVHGHVIDYWGHKLAGVPVEIGGTMVTTDELGGFAIDNVPAAYDASLVVEFPDNYSGEHYGWVFQGLTRRDPTLQVYAGLKVQGADLDITPTNTAATLTGTRTMTVALGGADGSDELTGVSGPSQDGVSWRGPGITQESAHALIFQQNAMVLPTGYYAYDTKLVALDGLSSAHGALMLDMTADTIASGNIVGAVTSTGTQTRANGVYLQFTSNAIITLAQDNGPASFTYLVPTIANSSVIFSASEGNSDIGDSFDGAYALVHKDALAAGTSGISAVIPKPATLLTEAPASSKTKVDSNTVFAFQPGAGSAGLYIVAFRQPDTTALRTDALFVVTTKKSLTIPKVVNDTFALDPSASYYWRVETHGAFATTDAAAGPTGFLDEFSGDFYGVVPSGPRRGSGSYTISDYSDEITMAP